MDFFKNFFNDENQVVGLCAFKKKKEKNLNLQFNFEPKFKATRLIYDTNTSNNFFLL